MKPAHARESGRPLLGVDCERSRQMGIQVVRKHMRTMGSVHRVTLILIHSLSRGLRDKAL